MVAVCALILAVYRRRWLHQVLVLIMFVPVAALLQALRLANGNQSEAARHLGVSRVTVWKRIKKYAIDLHHDL